MSRKNIILSLLFFALCLSIELRSETCSESTVQITVTSQHYNYYSPWKKRSVRKIECAGAVISKSMIVMKAEPLSDHILIEVRKHGDTKKYNADVLVKDYRSGLAIITAMDKKFFENLKPVDFSGPERLQGKKGVLVKWDTGGVFKEFAVEIYKSSMEKTSTEQFESDYSVLVHHITSGIVNGGNGEPVFVKGKFIGLATWFDSKNRSLQVTDRGLIRLMMDEIRESYTKKRRSGKTGKYSGMPFFLASMTPLRSDVNLKAYLGLSDKDTGLYVSNISPLSSGYGALQNGDVILSINGKNIDDSGMYDSGTYGRLDYIGLIYGNHRVGDPITMTVTRNNKKASIKFKLEPYPENKIIVPEICFDSPPSYYIYGGLIFLELSRGYLNLWGPEWESKANKRMIMAYQKSKYQKPEDNKHIVILNRVLPANVNRGYLNKRYLVLEKVNGKEVNNLKHAFRIITSSTNTYVRFDFIGNDTIILNREDAVRSISEIKSKYDIESLYRN